MFDSDWVCNLKNCNVELLCQLIRRESKSSLWVTFWKSPCQPPAFVSVPVILPFLCFICSPLLLPAAPLSSTLPQLLLLLLLLPSSSPAPLFLLSSAQHFCRALISPHSSLSSSSVSFVLWLQRLNLLAKHTKSHTCKCKQGRAKKTPACIFFHHLPSHRRSLGLRAVCQNWKKSCVGTLSSFQRCLAHFYWQYGFQ